MIEVIRLSTGTVEYIDTSPRSHADYSVYDGEYADEASMEGLRRSAQRVYGWNAKRCNRYSLPAETSWKSYRYTQY
jgi:hypothetical protein